MALPAKIAYAFTWIFDCLTERGISTTAAIAWSTIEDYYFDWYYGTETHRVVDTDRLEASLENGAFAVRYQPSKARPFQRLFARLQFPVNSTFVDLGSGKGKTLMLAAQRAPRFQRVVGIEFSPQLCELARRNIQIFHRKVPKLVPIEVVNADVTKCTLRGDENVFYMYNPFQENILAGFLEVVRRSLAEHPRQVWIVYSVPLFSRVIDNSGLFPERTQLTSGGYEVFVYTTGALRERASHMAAASSGA